MRSFLLAAAFGALSMATPVPQDIDLDMVEAAPDPTYTEAVGVTAQTVVYNTQTLVAQATSVTSVTVQSVAAAPTDDSAARLAKRGNCATQPPGATGAPAYSPDSASAFVSQTSFGAVASAAPTPSGYDQTFVNLGASNNAYGYMGFTTLQTYDTQACASKCDKMNGCMAVNIYFERDPSLDPGANCPNPSSVTMIKCVFWGGPVTSGNALNNGQYRQNFQVVIAGSNGYVNKTLATPAGYTGPVYLGNAAINAPYDSQGYNTFMGSKIFTSGPYNVQLCADYCTSQNTYNLANPPTDGSPVQTCQFFNSYILYKNTPSNSQGQYCAIYSESWDPSYATNTGQYRGSDHYMIDYSYTYTNNTGIIAPNKNGAIHQASKDITYSTLQSYCSTLLGYTTPVTTVTATTTTTPLTSSTSTSYIATVTATTTTGTFPGGAKKRQDETTPNVQFLNPSAAATDPAFSSIIAQNRKRDVSTPAVLTKYPATVVSSACSLVATAVTSTSTSTVTNTVTASTATVVVGVTATSTTLVVQPTCPANAQNGAVLTVNNGCACKYTESCGKLPSGSCHYNAGKQATLAQCVTVCDNYGDCAGVDYAADGTCTLCDTENYAGGITGDGTANYVAAFRQRGGCSNKNCATA